MFKSGGEHLTLVSSYICYVIKNELSKASSFVLSYLKKKAV